MWEKDYGMTTLRGILYMHVAGIRMAASVACWYANYHMTSSV